MPFMVNGTIPSSLKVDDQFISVWPLSQAQRLVESIGAHLPHECSIGLSAPSAGVHVSLNHPNSSGFALSYRVSACETHLQDLPAPCIHLFETWCCRSTRWRSVLKCWKTRTERRYVGRLLFLQVSAGRYQLSSHDIEQETNSRGVLL